MLREQQSSSADLSGAAQTLVRQGRLLWLVLVADESGRLPKPPRDFVRSARRHVLVLGGRRSFGALATAMERGAHAALDADQPFETLIRKLAQELAHPSADHPAAIAVARLRRRESEALRFGLLSARELEVLAALVEGRSAAQIATAEHVTMATVRSHIRAILTKLGVSSQLAAVTMAHRSCREAVVVDRMRRIINFDDDESVSESSR
ncbi:LuxR C-terminal-related transcriptional regulator [Geodermatophilus sp. TF02-6]|uniref:helix-turn-helix transcriptional regulator n=1 Tax=Geodermatophilus sp. TF02-6 TaxID=2250575 RepID=UPI001314C3C3|nr:LuxR C-terminal-related transcriptional regulator [Geodermatophilus sp. TF02-6]